MADITERDRNDLWAEMPPSGKKRLQQENSQPEPAPERKSDNNKGENKKSKPDNKKPAKKRKNKKGNTKTEAANKPPEPADDNAGASPKAQRMPQFLSENTRTDIPVVKPVDIQNRVLRNKPRSNGDTRERKRRKRLSAYIVYYVIFGILAVVILAVLSTTVLFNLSKYRITGDTVYTEQQIIDATGVNVGDNLILMDAGAVKDRLIAALPYVDKVEVSRNIFTCALEIKLNPATAVANVKKNDLYYLVSENGRIMDAELKTPDKNCVIVLGFEPEYAKSGDFLSVTDEGSRNMLTKLLRAVKTYDEIDDENEYEAQQKYDCVFALIELCNELGISEHIKTIDVSSIYGIKLSYDNKLTLELGDMTDAKLKLTVAKNLIEKGEFDGEKGILVLSQLSENTYNMKVTFRPEYNDTSKDDTSSSEPEPTPDTPDNSEPVPGDTTDPSEPAE